MKLRFTERADKDYAAMPVALRKAFEKQLRFLLANRAHPSLNPGPGWLTATLALIGLRHGSDHADLQRGSGLVSDGVGYVCGRWVCSGVIACRCAALPEGADGDDRRHRRRLLVGLCRFPAAATGQAV